MRPHLAGARGHVSWDDAADATASPAAVKGRNAEVQTIAQLAQRGFDVKAATDTTADIVAVDTDANEIRIEVKTAPPARNNKRVFVTDPAAQVDAHIFVDFDTANNAEFWVVPSSVVTSKGTKTGVLQQEDVEGYHNKWDALQSLRRG